MNPQGDLIDSIIAVYTAQRPDGLPEAFIFRPILSSAEKARPCTTLSVENGAFLHPRLYQGELVMLTEAASADATAEQAAGWASAVENALLARINAIAAALAAKGWKLKSLMTMAPGEAPNEDDGFEFEKRFQVRMLAAQAG